MEIACKGTEALISARNLSRSPSPSARRPQQQDPLPQEGSGRRQQLRLGPAQGQLAEGRVGPSRLEGLEQGESFGAEIQGRHVGVEQRRARPAPETGVAPARGRQQVAVELPVLVGLGTAAEEELKMADVGIELLHQLPLLALWQGQGPLQQLPLEQAGGIPDLGIGEAGKGEIGSLRSRLNKGEQARQVVAGLLGMEVHVGEVGICRRIQGPALPVVAGEAVAVRQLLKQLAAQAQPFLPRTHAQQAQGPLAAVDFPAAAVGIEKQMEHPPWLEQGRQGGQPRLGLAQVVQDPHRIDVVEGAFASQLQQAALLDPNGGTLVAAGASQPLPGHGQGPGTDIHRQQFAAWIEMG